jgi:hypothetical protein
MSVELSFQHYILADLCIHSLTRTPVFCAWLQQKRRAAEERMRHETAQRSLKELEQVLSVSFKERSVLVIYAVDWEREQSDSKP